MLTFSVFRITAPVKAHAAMVWSTQVDIISSTEKSQKNKTYQMTDVYKTMPYNF